MAGEEALADISTNQLILKLLQELAARVDNLERTNDNESEPKVLPPDTPTEISNVQDSPTPEKDQRNFPRRIQFPRKEIDPACCVTCKKKLGGEDADDRCDCFEIPYGYMLDGETPREGAELESIADRFLTLEPHLAEKLLRLGYGGVPADGRIPFVNFWEPQNSKSLTEALNIIEAPSTIGVRLEVMDINLSGVTRVYKPGQNLPGGLKPDQEPSFDTAPARVSPDPSVQWSAPWNRLIVIDGLSKVPVDDQSYPVVDESFPDDVPFVHALHRYIHVHRSQTSMYYIGRPELEVDNHQFHLFHLSWLKIVRHPLASKSWKHGILRGGRFGGDFFLQEFAYSIHGVTEIEGIDDERRQFWTITVFPSPEEYHSESAVESLQRLPERSTADSPFIVMITRCILIPLRLAHNAWSLLADQIDSLLGTGEELFDVDAHDNLIFDDDLYTRSRRYFWVINFLNEADKSVLENIQTWEEYKERGNFYTERFRLHGADRRNAQFANIIEDCDRAAKDLKKDLDRFREQRTKAVALRDGLFSASAVMESRASTRLGENVKLLTYVSIFYLPLSFCTSLWSTTDIFGWNNLAYTITGVGILTYFIVFNLDNLVKIAKRRYESLKIRVIGTMQRDNREEWTERGHLFMEYKPMKNSGKEKPSEWWVLFYAFMRPLSVLRFKPMRVKNAAGSEDWMTE